MPKQGFTQAFLHRVIATLLLCTLIFTTVYAEKSSWHTVAPGIQYQDLKEGTLAPWSHIHVFRINPKLHSFSLVTAKELGLPFASVHTFASRKNALIAINGGFFDKNYHPLGLRIQNSKIINPIKNISWWGVFYIKNNTAHISSLRGFKRNASYAFAIQSGPRLIINNQIPSLKPGLAERTALGIDSQGYVIVLVTDNAIMTTTELAQIFKQSPLSCANAINLDGGTSTQLHADIKDFKLNVHGFANVSDAIIIH